MNIKISTVYETEMGIFSATTEDKVGTMTEFLRLTDSHLEKEGSIERKIENNLLKL